MNDPRIVREKIREVLRFAPARRFTERMIFDALNMGLLPEPLTTPQLKEGLAWNHERDLIDAKEDARLEEVTWQITKKGLKA
jgi:hypothetical protein